MANFLGNILGSAVGGLAGGLPGAIFGMLGGGGSSKPYQTNSTSLRPLTSDERGNMRGAMTGLRGLGTGPYSQDIFDMLFKPAAEDTRRTFSRENGRREFMFKSTGGGPSSVRNQAGREGAAEEARAMSRLRGDTANTAAGITSNSRRDLLAQYGAILSGSNVGAGQSTYFPQDNNNSLLSMGMDALINKDSWWNKGGKGSLAGLFGGGGKAGGGGGGNMFTGDYGDFSLKPVDPRLLSFNP